MASSAVPFLLLAASAAPGSMRWDASGMLGLLGAEKTRQEVTGLQIKPGVRCVRLVYVLIKK
jgi:hypothetical protein